VILAPSEFNAFLRIMAQRARWSPSRLCPCRDAYSGAANPGCPVCRGQGVFWTGSKSVSIALSGQRVARAWRDFGMYESGDVVLSIGSDSPAYAAGENDKLVLTDSTTPYTAVFTRGDQAENWPAELVEVQAVTTIANGEPVEMSPPPIPTGGGAPSWPALGSPAPGQQYTLTGRRNPSFYVFADFPQDRAHHGGAALPRRVVARLIDLWAKR